MKTHHIWMAITIVACLVVVPLCVIAMHRYPEPPALQLMPSERMLLTPPVIELPEEADEPQQFTAKQLAASPPSFEEVDDGLDRAIQESAREYGESLERLSELEEADHDLADKRITEREWWQRARNAPGGIDTQKRLERNTRRAERLRKVLEDQEAGRIDNATARRKAVEIWNEQ